MIDSYNIAYEDQDLLVIDKARGVAVQNKTNDALIDILTKKYRQDLHLISRLDQPVTGLFVVAKSSDCAQQLSMQLALGTLSKKYTAIVEGKVKQSRETLEHTLLKVNQKAYVNEKGKNCKLTYTKLPSLNSYDVLDVEIATGRFHQIRAQLSAHGHPIKGDLKYGAKRSIKGGGICLHCREISFLHPKSKETIEVISNLPSYDVWQFVAR